VEHTREKTILTNMTIEFSSPVRVQLAALSDKSETLEAFRRSHLSVVQTLCLIMSSWLLYHRNDTDGFINMCWREQGLAEMH